MYKILFQRRSVDLKMNLESYNQYQECLTKKDKVAWLSSFSPLTFQITNQSQNSNTIYANVC